MSATGSPTTPSSATALMARLRAAGDSDPVLGIERTVAALREATAARQRILDEVRSDLRTRREKARQRHDRALATNQQRRTDALAREDAEHAGSTEAARERRAAALAGLAEATKSRADELETSHATMLESHRRALEEAIVLAEGMREAGEESDRQRTRALRERLDEADRRVEALKAEARQFVRGCKLSMPRSHPAPDAGSAGGGASDPAETEIAARIAGAEEHLVAMRASRPARLLAGIGPFVLGPALVIGGAVAGLLYALVHGLEPKDMWKPVAIAGGTALVLVVLAFLVVRQVATSALLKVWRPFEEDLAAIGAARTRAESEDARLHVETIERLRANEAAEEKAAHEEHDGPIADVPKALRRRLARLEETRAARTSEFEAAFAESVAAADATRAERRAAIEREAEATERAEIERAAGEARALDLEEIDRLRDARERWLRIATESRELLAFAEATDAAIRPAWPAVDLGNFATERAPWFGFGSVDLEPAALEGGLPDDPAFAVEMPERFALPAALGFPLRGSLVFETTSDLRPAALAAVQSLVTRLLTSIPPSKSRFTFIDPVGLGESFAAFMRLGDEFEQLVGERIWTEPRAIEQRLADLSEHMETVIQKYLRNEFRDIDAYNEAAGEIAEPYRFLVCADFPAAFSEQAAQRLVSILRAGPRCGVHVILLRDRNAALPDGIRADDLAESCQIVRGEKGGGFGFASGPFAGLPLVLERPLPDERLIPLLGRIGAAAKSAARVEVPFDVIAPKPDAFWSLSSAGGLRVPVGRAGATRLQHFLLGEGTSQHALIAGKTGSGKSTLLHAIITGLATWYSPDEVELWLIDFKKGVEFKTYAEHALAHARAVAIESDREFGLSVLEGLDRELSRRGELFREAGVQDVSSYRKARPKERMPRILLVIDEFQEFFLDDDRVSQGAAMLLDRIVRQGRAFGMHALLGSQTLGGAYSLARSTMGQMGVRIALQCSEADSQLILSDENLAARLLSRPGEAIYNDAGGRIEGNSPFQVAFLPDAQRDRWLDEAQVRAKGRFDTLPRIVFEGDARASIALHPGLRAGTSPDARGNVRLWFGEAVAIKEPTCARLPRAAGANVACVSSRDEQAVATTAAILASIARETPDAAIDLLDGTPADAPEHGVLARFIAAHGIRADLVAYRDAEARIAEIAGDVTERAAGVSRPRRFLVIHQLQRFRSLRRNDDDFSFGASDAPPSPDKLLAGIVREGAIGGVHVIVCCDTLASLQRAFDRNLLREFDWKALYQMSPADSSALVDSPAASRLGTNRGLLYSEELGLLEKFRPYAL